MNTLKALFIIALLGAVAYGVYLSLERNPQTPAAADNAPPWPEIPQLQIQPGPEATAQYDGSYYASSATTPVPAADLPAMELPLTAGGTPGAATYIPSSPPALPEVLPADVAPPPAPAGGQFGVGGSVASPSSVYASDNPLPPLGHSDDPGSPSNSLRGAQEATSNPLPGRDLPSAPRDDLSLFMQAVQAKLDAGELAEAHLALSSLYDAPELPPEQARKVTELLDQLAGTVIYSRQSLMGPFYRVQEGDTLEQIALDCNVPWRLLARINGIRDGESLQPGRELKLVRGPFDALVHLDRYELTLFLGGRYAGRFPIGVGRDHQTLEGSYVVRNKTVNPPYFGPDGDIAPNDPNNPLGEHLIDLGNQIGIHGTNNPQNLHRSGGRGSICLGDRDIEDVFGILSIGSRVVIRR